MLGTVAALAAALAGCGSTASNGADASVVSVVVTSPMSGSVIAANNVTVRGMVTPVNAVVPAGITCRNTTTGHGFEASRVAARRKVY